jgi:hypothetical protein
MLSSNEGSMRPLIALSFATLLLCNGPAFAGDPCIEFTPTNSWRQAASYKTDGPLPWVMSRKGHVLFALQRKALAQQADDGGTLSPEHRSALQAELNAINSGHY